MSDISSVPPTHSASLNNKSSSQQHLILNAPKTIQNLPNGSTLTGTISGNTIVPPNISALTLNTSLGSLTLTTTLPLETGHNVSLKIIQSQNQIHASLEAINGKNIQSSQQNNNNSTQNQLEQNTSNSTIPNAGKALHEIISRQQNQPILFSFTTTNQTSKDVTSQAHNRYYGEAVTIDNNSQNITSKNFASYFSSKNTPALEQAILGSRFLMERFSQKQPGQTGQAPTNTSQQNAPGKQLPSSLSNTLLTDITGLNVKIRDFKLPLTTNNQSLTALATTNNTTQPKSSLINGLITGNSGQSTTIQSPLGTLHINDLNLPKGTEIQFEILSLFTNDDPTQPLNTNNDGNNSFLKILKHLDFFRELLQVPNNSSETQLLKQLLPNSQGPDFLKQLINLGRSVGNNDLGPLLQQSIRSNISRESNSILDKLRTFIDSAHNLSSDTGNKSWQSFLLPIFDANDEIQPIHLFIRPDNPSDSDDTTNSSSDHTMKNPNEIRFIIEIDLESSGHIQLDGLYRNEEAKARHFNLIIRSKQDLDSQLSKGISEIFSSYMELSGMSGSLIIQQHDPFPVNPREDNEHYSSHPVSI